MVVTETVLFNTNPVLTLLIWQVEHKWHCRCVSGTSQCWLLLEASLRTSFMALACLPSGVLGSSRSENRTTERPGHRAHSGGSRDRIAPRIERSLTAAPRTNLLGPMEILCCEEWHSRVPLRIRRWTIKNSPDNSPSEQSEWHGGPSGGHLGVNKTLNKVRQRYYWLQARKNVEKWCWQCNTCAAGHGAQTRNWGQMHQYIRAPLKRLAIPSHGVTKETDTSW